MELLGSSAVTFQVVLTKCDKLRKPELDKIIEKTRATLSKFPAAYPEIVLTSSNKGEGLDVLRTIIATME